MAQMTDLRADNITENVHAISESLPLCMSWAEINWFLDSGCEDERLKFIMEKLVTHAHAFIQETSITTEEWMTGLKFLTAVGQKCTDIRQVSSSCERKVEPY